MPDGIAKANLRIHPSGLLRHPDTKGRLGLLRLCFAKLLAALVGQPDAFGAGEFFGRHETSRKLRTDLGRCLNPSTRMEDEP